MNIHISDSKDHVKCYGAKCRIGGINGHKLICLGINRALIGMLSAPTVRGDDFTIIAFQTATGSQTAFVAKS